MRWCVVTVCCFACTSSEAPTGNLVLELQPHHQAEATDAEWVRGSAIVVADAPTFPQPLAARIRVVDDAGADLGVAHVSLSMYGPMQLEAIQTTSGCSYWVPDEAARYCSYDFDVVGVGASLLAVSANAPYRSGIRDCVYYAAVDSTTDVDVLRADLDAQADACRTR